MAGERTGLKRTDCTLSVPHWNWLMGSDRWWSHTSTHGPAVTNRSFWKWCDTPVKSNRDFSRVSIVLGRVRVQLVGFQNGSSIIQWG